MPTALVTGSNRGIGLEFVRQCAAEGWRVHATCRDPARATALRAIEGNVRIHLLEVTDPASRAALARTLGSEAIDVLINNAGLYGPKSVKLDALDYKLWEEILRINAIGPVALTAALANNVARSNRKLVIALSTGMASIARATGGEYAYRSSKAALNMAMKSLAGELAPRGIVCVMISPGWVKTDMGGPQAPTSVEDSVRGTRKVIAGLGPKDSGRFLNFEGHEIPW